MSMTDAERDLDDLFTQARTGSGALPSNDLLARVMADAERSLQAMSVAAAPAPAARPRFWPQMRQALGGWGGIGGLVTASFAGLWLGLAGVGSDMGLLTGTNSTTIDLAPDTYALLATEE